MRLAIDAMGNDRGPAPVVAGAASFLRNTPDASLLLVGQAERIEEALASVGDVPRERIEILHASQTIEMHEKVASLREKRDSSVLRLFEALKEGKAEAAVSLGNTAATVGAACLRLRHLEGVHRAGIAVPFPTRAGRPCVVIDMGANTEAKTRHLVDYAIMASIYGERVLHTPEPRVGLLNVGEEEGKGNRMLREAYEALERAPVRFVGNVEGGDVFSGRCDVMVCDGFVGNVVLKASEGMAETLRVWLREAFGSGLLARLGGLLARPALKKMLRRGSYATYGGAPLLGVNGICIIGHGRSSPDAVANALRVACESASVGLNRLIRDALEEKEAALSGPPADVVS